MKFIRSKILSLCYLFLSLSSIQMRASTELASTIGMMATLGIVSGSLSGLLFYKSIPIITKDNTIIAEEMIVTLQKSIAKRRTSIHESIEKLEHELESIKTQSFPSEESQMQEKRITSKLNILYEENKTLESDYQSEYLRIRPQVLFFKVAAVIGTFFAVPLAITALNSTFVTLSFLAASNNK